MSEKKFKVGDIVVVTDLTSSLLGIECEVVTVDDDPHTEWPYEVTDGVENEWFMEEHLESKPLLIPQPEPATPTAQWQKEAEEMYPLDSRLQDMMCPYPHVVSDERKAHIKARELAHVSHAAHLAQLQGEIDEVNKLLCSISPDTPFALARLFINKAVEMLVSLPSLRTITQTKMKG